MTHYTIWYIAREPLRYEPIRTKDGAVRRFTADAKRAFFQRWLPRYGSLNSVTGDGPPPFKLTQLPSGLVAHGMGINDRPR